MIGISIYMTTPQPDINITLPHLDLNLAERRLTTEALLCTETLAEAAALLGINRQVLRRLISKHSIEWWPYSPAGPPSASENSTSSPSVDAAAERAKRRGGANSFGFSFRKKFSATVSERAAATFS